MAKICVVIEDDGSLKVGVEPMGEEEGGMPADPFAGEEEAGEEDSYLEPVGDVQELLMKVEELVAANMPEEMKQQEMQAEADFESGFKSAGGM